MRAAPRLRVASEKKGFTVILFERLHAAGEVARQEGRRFCQMTSPMTGLMTSPMAGLWSARGMTGIGKHGAKSGS